MTSLRLCKAVIKVDIMITGRVARHNRQLCLRVLDLFRMYSHTASLVAKDLRLPPMPTVRDLLRLYRINAQKHLSQNFLLEPRLMNKIAKAATLKSRDLEGAFAVEVGPGPGGITRALLGNGVAHLTVIEKDRRFLPTLQMLQEVSEGRLNVLLGDVLSFDMSNLFPEDLRREWEEGEIHDDKTETSSSEEEGLQPKKKWKRPRLEGRMPKICVVGNLPFNISTPLLIRWIKDISERRNVWSYGRIPMTLTFQKEVAERMVAGIGQWQRCRLSVMCQNWCYVDHKFNIPGSAFIPPPMVDVGVVRLVPRPYPVIPLPFPLIEKVVRTIFSSRQKYIKHTAARLFPPGKGGDNKRLPSREELTDEFFLLSGVNPNIRSFRTSIHEFGCLCKSYLEMCNKYRSLERYEYRGSNSLEYDEEVDEMDEKILETKWAGFDDAVGRFK